MQLINSPTAAQFPSVEIALEKQRLTRYYRLGAHDNAAAFALYRWNCALCESFIFSLHISEVLCRNALHRALLNRIGAAWYADRTFRSILNDRFQKELLDVCTEEGIAHGAAMTNHHVVSGLTFGFWEHLVTKRFERFFWAKGIHGAFPGAPKGKTYEDLHGLMKV